MRQHVRYANFEEQKRNGKFDNIIVKDYKEFYNTRLLSFDIKTLTNPGPGSYSSCTLLYRGMGNCQVYLIGWINRILAMCDTEEKFHNVMREAFQALWWSINPVDIPRKGYFQFDILNRDKTTKFVNWIQPHLIGSYDYKSTNTSELTTGSFNIMKKVFPEHYPDSNIVAVTPAVSALVPAVLYPATFDEVEEHNSFEDEPLQVEELVSDPNVGGPVVIN